MNGNIVILGILIRLKGIWIKMIKQRFMLDSNIVIDTLNHKLDLLAFLDNYPDCEVYINLIVKIEVLAKTNMSENEEFEVRAFLNLFKWFEIDRNTSEIAIQIRRTRELRLPDALIAASSISLNATVLSNDPHLRDYKRSDYKSMPCLLSA